MDERDFKSVISGELRSAYGEYLYFHPHNLPFNLHISEGIGAKCRRALVALSKLDGKASEIDPLEREMFLRIFTLRESTSSSSIEGTRSTLDDIFRYEMEPPASDNNMRDAQEILNYKRALDLGMKELKSGKPIDVSLLNMLHKVLMTSVRCENESPGKFRENQNMIGSPGIPWTRRRWCHPAPRKSTISSRISSIS